MNGCACVILCPLLFVGTLVIDEDIDMKSCKRNHLAYSNNKGEKKNSLNLPCGKSLKQLAVDHHVTLLTEDDTSVAAFITGFVVEGIIHQCHWQISNLSDNQKKAIWMVMLSMTEHLGRSLEVTDEQAAEYAAMWVFRHDNRYLFGSMIREMKKEYIGLKSETSKRALLALLNRSITALLSDGDILYTKRIARVTGLLARAPEKFLHVH
jgi:hypothetical protein